MRKGENPLREQFPEGALEEKEMGGKMKSKREIYFEKIHYSDPGWDAEVIPVAGGDDVAIAMTRMDPYGNRKMYGQVLFIFRHRKTAEKLCRELNQRKGELLARAYPLARTANL